MNVSKNKEWLRHCFYKCDPNTRYSRLIKITVLHFIYSPLKNLLYTNLNVSKSSKKLE